MTFSVSTDDEALLKQIEDKLNGNSSTTFDACIKDGFIVVNGKRALIVRGWGHLTGIGSLNLAYDTAAKIQDDFAEWVVNTLKK